MKYSQNSKIMQISEKTLIIGVDIASEVHFARAFDYRGVELAKILRFTNDEPGFKEFAAWVEEIKSKNHKDKVTVGMEPTGHYWFNIAPFLKDHSMKIVLVNPFHVKRSKELDDNNPTKNDRKDPKTIAMLVKDGRYMEPYIPEGVYSELRTAMDTRWHIVKQLNVIRNKVLRWLSIYFPEYRTVFGDWEGKAALIVLKEFPLPKQIIEKGVTGIVARWKQDKIRAVGIKRAVALVEAAKRSVGVKEGIISAMNDITMLLEDYDLKMAQYNRVMELVEQHSKQIPGMEEILKIKGIGLIMAAGFVAEVGDIKRFEHSKQIQKLAGLNLKENSSGKHKGKTTISKRGRSRLRAILFQGMLPLVAQNAAFKELHEYYTTRKGNALGKKQSLVLLCCKLIRIFYALLTKGIEYDSQKMMSDIRSNSTSEAA